MADGIPQGRRPDLQGGGLLRSAGGWAGLTALRRARAAYVGDARVLGGSDFVARVQREGTPDLEPPVPACSIETLRARVCAQVGITPDALQGGGRLPAVTRARAGIAYLWVERLGRSGRPLASVLGLHAAVVYQAARRGAAQAREWEALLEKIGKAT